MGDVMRHRREAAMHRYFAVDSAQVIEIGDLCWLNTDDVRAASDFTWDTSLAVTQRAFALVFAGCAADRSQSGETDDVAIETAGVKEFTCASATFEQGDLVGVAKASGNALEDQKVIAVASRDLAIGKVAKRYSSATTTVLVEIFPPVNRDSLTSEQIIDMIENDVAGGIVLDSDFSSDEGFMRKISDGTYGTHKSNLSAAVAPSAVDDSDDGYSVGSVWIDTTTGKIYQCVDSSVGTAVWNELTDDQTGVEITALLEALAGTNKLKALAIQGISGVDKLFVGSATADATDGTNNYVEVDTGFGAAPDGALVMILRAGVNILEDGIITLEAGGTVKIADGAATYVVTDGDVVYVLAWKNSA